MIKTALFSIFFLIFAVPSFAKSSATVNINNNVSSNSNSNIKSSTDIRIETNGNVTTYSSDKAKNIEIKAENGKSEIKVNGVVVSQSPTQAQTSPTRAPTPSGEPDEEETNGDSNKNIFEVFEDLFKKFFSLLV